uniref:Cilia- and flagella-associated protein 206 n=1 Tax=Labrus bergylta TaxID=56723 RepID=A0A3Q3N2P3_9LABR
PPPTRTESLRRKARRMRECAVRGHAVSETLVAFMVKAVVLDPRNGFNVDRILTKQDVQKLEEVSLVLNYFFSL